MSSLRTNSIDTRNLSPSLLIARDGEDGLRNNVGAATFLALPIILNARSVLTSPQPTEQQVLNAVNIAADAFNQNLNQVRACDSFQQLASTYLNNISRQVVAVVRILFELNQFRPGFGAGTVAGASYTLNIVGAFNSQGTSAATNPFYKLEEILVDIRAMIDAIANRDVAETTRIRALINPTRFAVALNDAYINLATNSYLSIPGIGPAPSAINHESPSTNPLSPNSPLQGFFLQLVDAASAKTAESLDALAALASQ